MSEPMNPKIKRLVKRLIGLRKESDELRENPPDSQNFFPTPARKKFFLELNKVAGQIMTAERQIIDESVKAYKP